MFKVKPSLSVLSLFVLCSLASVMLATQANAAAKDQIAARLEPVGKVCVVGDDCAKGVKMPGAASAGAKTPESVYNGAMPPKGTCMDCSDDDLKATVDYLISAAKK